MDTLFSLITNLLEPLSYFIYFFAFLLQYKKGGQERNYRIALSFYFLMGILMSYSSYLAQKGATNTYIYNYLLLPASFIFFSYYFYQILCSTKKKKVVSLLLIINSITFITGLFFGNKDGFFNSFGFSVLNMTVVIYCFLFFHQKINEISERSIFSDFNFWVVCSFFFSFSGSFAVMLTYYYLTEKIITSYIKENRYLLTLLWAIPNMLIMTGSLFTLTGYIWAQYHRKSS